MKRGKIPGLLSQEQNGGRSGRTSIEVVVLISLLFECVIHIRINYGIGFYDTENFYDCVAHNFASLTDQYFDMLLLEIIFCLKSIQEIKLYLRTVFGDFKRIILQNKYTTLSSNVPGEWSTTSMLISGRLHYYSILKI